MNQIYSNEQAHIKALENIEQQIGQNLLQDAALGLNKLAKVNALDPRLFLLGAELAKAAGNSAGILVAARRAQAIAPQWSTSAIYLAETLVAQGEEAEALSMAHHAVEVAAQENAVTTELLTRAASVAQRCNRVADAWRLLRQALKMAPEDAALLRLMSRTLVAMGDAGGAAELLAELLVQYPGHESIRLERARTLIAARQFDAAIQECESLLLVAPGNEIYAFFLELARGKTPRTQPPALIGKVFDEAAAKYDALFVKGFNYLLPQAVAAQLAQVYPGGDGDILDLGCGTGLLGRALQPWVGVLVGVDLSKQMIAQAIGSGAYASFHQVNLLDALRATPASHYDAITALDVLGFVGDLDSAVPDAFRILTPGGKFIFSYEKSATPDADYTLNDDLIYTYRASYVSDLLERSGFIDITVMPFKLRVEAGVHVVGQLVHATKPCVTPASEVI